MNYFEESKFDPIKDTGKHRSIRSTSTDLKAASPATEGRERPESNLESREPEDVLPDQRDNNK
jgi:hypothetical protein